MQSASVLDMKALKIKVIMQKLEDPYAKSCGILDWWLSEWILKKIGATPILRLFIGFEIVDAKEQMICKNTEEFEILMF